MFLLSACASLPKGSPGPFHDINRANFALNEAFDHAVLRPAAHFYVRTIPHPVRIGVHNVFENLGNPVIAVNEFLEGRLRPGIDESGRFLANSTFGVLGLFDVASPMGLRAHHADFDLTLAHWGVPRGPYLVLPLFGPGSLRSLAGIAVDSYYGSPLEYIRSTATRNELTVLELLDLRAHLIGTFHLIYSAPDPYLMMKDGYQAHQRYEFYHGNPPIQYPALGPPGGSGGH
ncbi:VacJ-like lipoprotein [mine drainage metagenome]|uniref:VacJ-like lipoprotein n=2 Tax=mine drainage metagenome TaxID=410659 RepID=T1BL53_9ZZZZ